VLIRKIVSVWFCCSIVLLSFQPAHSTDVGGIINTDTTWSLANSPYTITSTIELDEGTTLTIEPGVVIDGSGVFEDIKVWGSLIAVGSEQSKIVFNNVKIVGVEVAGATSVAEIQYATFNITDASEQSGLPRGRFASFILRDSTAQNSSCCGYGWGMSYPTGDCYIERNVFNNTMGMGLNTTGPKIYIKNNVFYQQRGDAIAVDLNHTVSNIVLEHNSFLDTDRIVLRLNQGRDANLDASNNFWNTSDTNVIDSMIWDRNDTLDCQEYINYDPILSEPHQDTPSLNTNQLPIANAGSDKVDNIPVTLDASGSIDPDGSIVGYSWALQHGTNPAFNRTASGINPTIDDLESGFYDVILTVTDNDGAIDTDNMLLGVAGHWDMSGDDQLGLEEIIYGLQVLSGER